MNKRASYHDDFSETEDIRAKEIMTTVSFRFLKVHGRIPASIPSFVFRMELEYVEVIKCNT